MQAKIEKYFFKEKDNAFKRHTVLLFFKKGLTTTFELRNYFKEKGDLPM